MLDFAPDFILRCIFAFLRIGAILFALPIIGETTVPIKFRILLAATLVVTIVPILPESYLTHLPTTTEAAVLLCARELVIGLMIGMIARFFFDGMLMGASLVGFQMGFGTASLLMPGTDLQMNSFTAFHRMLMLLIFFSLSLHHVFLSAIMESFRIIPNVMHGLQGQLGAIILKASTEVFVIAIRISAPILVAILFATAALGLIARTVPQLNVFTMSFPVSFFVGMLIYAATLPFYPSWIILDFQNTYQSILLVIENFIRT